MEEDGLLTPGSKRFWDHFYDEETGRLMEKELEHRKAQEVKEGGSLLDHYEWFMNFDLYGSALVDFVSEKLNSPARETDELRVLHMGCGNSDFCEHFSSAMHFKKEFASKEIQVLNIDLCENIIARLAAKYPERMYAVGNCCHLRAPDDSGEMALKADSTFWFHQKALPAPLVVLDSSTHVIFDKGTMDALLSAFPGEYNPNTQRYAEEAIRVLVCGGAWYIISINSVDVVDSYVLAVSDHNKSFRRMFQSTTSLATGDCNAIRVETLGSRYHCYGYVVVEEE